MKIGLKSSVRVFGELEVNVQLFTRDYRLSIGSHFSIFD